MKQKKLLVWLLTAILLVGLLPTAAIEDVLPIETAAENLLLTEEPISTEEVTAEPVATENAAEASATPTVTADMPEASIAQAATEGVPEAAAAPTALTLTHDATDLIDDVLYLKKGDCFTLHAHDENGNETPVIWENTSWNGGGVALNENTGEVEVLNDLYSGSTSYLYFKATSVLDASVSQKITVKMTGYLLSAYNKEKKATLSADGQKVTEVSITGGTGGHNIWSWNIPDGLAEVQSDPAGGNSIKFNVFRPGTFEVTYRLDINEALTDTATVTVSGVGVEDALGGRNKTYLSLSTETPHPTVQLLAFTAEEKPVTSWSSADEAIATVDENGLVTAQGIGSTIIKATDSDGTTGGILVVCRSMETPYFDDLQFLSSAIQNYTTAYRFTPTVTDYELALKTYTTTKLTLQNTTQFDDEQYQAVATYTDNSGAEQAVTVNNGAITYLEGLAFGVTEIDITLSSRENSELKTVYHLTVTRPRDTTKTIKNGGVVLVPDGRSLSPVKYNGYAEGTMFKLAEDGSFKTSWGSNLDVNVSPSHLSYKCFVLEQPEKVSLTISGGTAYTHLRYSTDGEVWSELPQGGGTTSPFAFGENEDDITVWIQILDDQTYTANTEAGLDGFAVGEVKAYSVIIERVNATADSAKLLTAVTDFGDWYPAAFNSGTYSYTIVVPKENGEATLTYTASPDAVVSLGKTEQTAVDGVYTLPLTTSQQQLTVTSADGAVSNTYSFKLQKKAEGYPDKVVDFLCINSQYTNGIGAGNGASPWVSLSGSFTSVGNFGGYITYYYEDAITDDPNHKYGIDFYVYGNANKDTSTSTKTSFFEPAQAWVSEDGETWYALAGSAHYDEGVDWDYSVTYQKNESGKTAWTDNRGNSHNGSSYAGQYPSASIYTMNDLAKGESIELSGIALPARNGKLASVGESTDAYPVKWGYADCFVNGTKGADVNPYLDNSNFDLNANGFDLSWAVDASGMPVDVSGKAFHYVKLVSASNIWHPSFGEKSPEIAGVVKTKPQSEAVGKTAMPESITLTDGAETKVVYLNAEERVYSVDVGSMKYLSVAVSGAAAEDNIYVNNMRIAYNETADGIKVTKESGERLIRVLVQNGDKEPVSVLLKLTGSATESNDLIEGIKLNISGSSRVADTKDGENYTASVGYRIKSINIYPVAAGDVVLSVNGAEPADSYELSAGENVFTIVGEKDGQIYTVTLTVTKEAAPSGGGSSAITVYFTLMGDEAHGESETVHTLKNGGLSTWLSKTAVSVNTPATVLDVLEKALDGKHSFVNADGNYISEIDGLKEFTNGMLSGWMYTLNGKYPTKGVAEQSVKNGDVIVFHYTDDYTQEKGAEKWASSGGSSSKGLTVRFETNGGSAVSSQSVAKNGTATKPSDPTKDGYEFIGWYSDAALTNAYDFSAKVTANITLYAAWQAKTEQTETNRIVLTIGRCEANLFGTVQMGDAAPKLVNGRTMLPIRFIAEALGATVEWNGEARQITVTGKNLKTGEAVTILLTVGSEWVSVNGTDVQSEAMVFIEQDRSYTPARLIAEALGATVTWVEETQNVIIIKP